LALHNYLNGTGFDVPLQNWLEFPVVASMHPAGLIDEFLFESIESKL
jgi:hypothetical protein